jgi:hypothetical protein
MNKIVETVIEGELNNLQNEYFPYKYLLLILLIVKEEE